MRKRTYTLAVLLTAATIATGWATQAASLLGSEQTIADSKGSDAKITRESAFAGSEGDEAGMIIAGSAGTKSKLARESS